MLIVLLCENERSPRRLVEVERLRGELRQRGIKTRVCAWRDRESLERGPMRDALIVLAMDRSATVDAAVAEWLQTGEAARTGRTLPSPELALSSFLDHGRSALCAAGVSCVVPDGASLPATHPDRDDNLVSVYVVGDTCTHAVRVVGGVRSRVTLGTADLLLASHASAVFAGHETGGHETPGEDAAGSGSPTDPTNEAGLSAPFMRVDLADSGGERRVVAVDPIVHTVCAHLHPPIVARLADAVCARLSEWLSEKDRVHSSPYVV